MALPLAVWLIYLVDRLLDTADGFPVHITARHTFYCTHRSFCRLLTAFVAFLLCVSVSLSPLPVVKNGLVVAAMVAGYLLMVHWMGGIWRHWLPKEAAVGLIFGVGTALAPFTRASDATGLLFPALLFGVLCWANSSAIEIWEGGNVDCASAWMVRNMKMVAGVTCAICALLVLTHFSENTAMALFISAMGYWGIADVHTGLPADLLRVAIDVPLLAPLLLIGRR
jgi:hypothetical protein